MNFETNPQPAPAPTPAPGIDPLQARLAALASKRSATPASATHPVRATSRTTTRTTTRRRHPAKHSRTAALALSFVATGGLGYLLAATDPGVSAASAAPVGIVTATAAATVPTVTAAAMTSSTHAVTPTAAATAPSTTSTTPTTVAPVIVADPIVVNGEAFTNKWGPVQVQATFAADGTLTSVDTLQTPTRDGKSIRINNSAVPRLNSGALTAQNANVDTVSGATYTSNGYRQSLQSAIDIAVASGIPAAATAA